MKLNRKGYMLVEMILASVIAMSIAYYLLNLTYKFKDKNEDIYNSTVLIADKILITKNIMNDFDGKIVKLINQSDKEITLSVNGITKKIIVDKNTIKYISETVEGFVGNEEDTTGNEEDTTGNEEDTTENGEDTTENGEDTTGNEEATTGSEEVIYSKTLDNSIEIGTITVDNNIITIPIKSIYSKNTNYIKIFIKDNFATTFYFTKSVQEYEIPEDGYYKIEAWGAQGGSSTLDGGTRAKENIPNSSCELDGEKGHCTGGRGAYTSGNIYLTKGEKLYIYVGEKGATGVVNADANGGWNGGGTGTHDHSDDEADGGGGGATDIRLVAGEWDDDNSLNSRIMVAAGGGGASDIHSGLPGGTLVNSNKSIKGEVRPKFEQTTQTKGYKFGIGEDGVYKRPNYPVAGGGGGYYGGYSKDNDTTFANMGAGGSSFISGYPGANAIKSEDDRTHTNQAKHYSGKIFEDGKMEEGKREGNGQAKITYIGNRN